MPKTRKIMRRGGSKQKSHAVTQLFRYATDAKHGHPFNCLQFGYNLGRLQEMEDGGKEGANKYWWTPLEPIVNETKWDELIALIETFKQRIKVDWEETTLAKIKK